MTLLELITDLRVRLLDDTGGTGIDWQDDANARLLRWSNTELTALINEAMSETTRRLKSITDVMTITVQAGTDTYNIDPIIYKIRRAKLALVSPTIKELSWKDLDATKPDWEDDTNTPEYFLLDWRKGKIRLYPTPIVPDTLSLNVYRYPVSDMELDNWDSDEPELEEEYQRNALYWAAKLAYEKDEPNVLDPNRSKDLASIYVGHFGMPESAYAIERKKRAKRQISYGGIPQSRRRDRGGYKDTGYW